MTSRILPCISARQGRLKHKEAAVCMASPCPTVPLPSLLFAPATECKGLVQCQGQPHVLTIHLPSCPGGPICDIRRGCRGAPCVAILMLMRMVVFGGREGARTRLNRLLTRSKGLECWSRGNRPPLMRSICRGDHIQ